MEHTKTPLTEWAFDAGNGHVHFKECRTSFICSVQDDDKGHQIVREHNSHAALVEVLEECHRYFTNRTGNHEIQLNELIGDALRQAKES